MMEVAVESPQPAAWDQFKEEVEIMEAEGGGGAAAAAGELLTREIKKRLLDHARENGNGHGHVNGGEAEELKPPQAQEEKEEEAAEEPKVAEEEQQRHKSIFFDATKDSTERASQEKIGRKVRKMAGMNLHAIASALVCSIRREIRRSARRHHAGTCRHRGRHSHRGPRSHHGPAPPVQQAGPSTQAVPVEMVAPALPVPAFVAPPMDWFLAGPSAPFLGEEDNLEAALVPPSTPSYYHGLCQTAPPPTPQLPTPTPSDEDLMHTFPPGYGPVPIMEDWEVVPTEEEQQWLTTAVKLEPTAPATADKTGGPIPDLNTAAGVQIEDVASSSTPPPTPALVTPPLPPSTLATPPPEARRILRRFAAALERHRPGLRSGSWAPAGLNLPDYPAGGPSLS